MKIYQLVYTQIETRTIQASSMKDAHDQAQAFRRFNPTVTLLKITELDLQTFDPNASAEPMNS